MLIAQASVQVRVSWRATRPDKHCKSASKSPRKGQRLPLLARPGARVALDFNIDCSRCHSRGGIPLSTRFPGVVMVRDGQGKKRQVMSKVVLSVAVAAGWLATTAFAADMAGQGAAAAARALGLGHRVRHRDDDRLQFPRRHAVGAQAVGRRLFRGRATTSTEHCSGMSACPARASTSRTTPRRKSTSTAASGRPSTSSPSISASGTTITRVASASTPACLTRACGELAVRAATPDLPNGNVIKANLSFYRVLRQGHLHRERQSGRSASARGTRRSVLNSGASAGTRRQRQVHGAEPPGSPRIGAATSPATSATGSSAPAMPSMASQPAGHFPDGIPYTSYWNWDAGIGFT